MRGLNTFFVFSFVLLLWVESSFSSTQCKALLNSKRTSVQLLTEIELIGRALPSSKSLEEANHQMALMTSIANRALDKVFGFMVELQTQPLHENYVQQQRAIADRIINELVFLFKIPPSAMKEAIENRMELERLHHNEWASAFNEKMKPGFQVGRLSDEHSETTESYSDVIGFKSNRSKDFLSFMAQVEAQQFAQLSSLLHVKTDENTAAEKSKDQGSKTSYEVGFVKRNETQDSPSDPIKPGFALEGDGSYESFDLHEVNQVYFDIETAEFKIES